MAKIIDQAFGTNWAFYNADCVLGMRNLPDNSIDFSVFSPPFLSLYIYSDSIADLGNTDSEEQFFDGWKFHLQELFRVLKPGKRIAIHCKDTMRYMTSHGYAGLFDFPGHIIRLCEEVGFTYERWITIWKDPVIEMQRTKTYGLLHMSFEGRGEVTRQGCADYVLIFGKGTDNQANDELPFPNEYVIERCVHQWTNEGETISTPLMADIRGRFNETSTSYQYVFMSEKEYSDEFIRQLLDYVDNGRLFTAHCTAKMMRDIVLKFETNGWKFHSRCALTDGTFLVTFRNWSQGKPDNNIVKHNLQPPDVDYQRFELVTSQVVNIDGEVETIQEVKETWKEPILRGNEDHPDYVGIDKPLGWRDRKYYSILVWQRYASPVWFDLPGSPQTHPDCWMNIIQTNVLNYRQSKQEDEEKHICPLQLDLIGQLVREYTKPGEVTLTPYGGISSEGYMSIKLGRRAILFELKSDYWRMGIKNLKEAEMSITQERMI
jgi:DNA modification methylase